LRITVFSPSAKTAKGQCTEWYIAPFYYKNYKMAFTIVKSADQFFHDTEDLKIEGNSFFTSYPEFLRYFDDIQNIERHNLIIGINFTYGWMPTIFDFRSDKFDAALTVLSRAKKGEQVSKEELETLKGLFNNSLVGTSKLLHFVSPNNFAIWDSRVYRYLTGEEPNEHRIGNCESYLKYLKFCNELTADSRFNNLRTTIEGQVEYPMTPLRLVELGMFLNGGKSTK
jgi:hypothetical protein